MGECPDIGQWEGLETGRVDVGAARALDEHAARCPACRDLRDGMRRNQRMLGAIREALRDGQKDKGVEARAAHSLVGRKLGKYQVVRMLGAGGMATVYEAEQEHPRRAVALKVIHAGLMFGPGAAGAMKRLEQEGDLVARLQHPGIAPVYEATTVESEFGPLPVLAMELVRGEPLTRYASDAHLGIRERLELIAKVCDAVQHAHSKGVIHRDLKPSNVLVDSAGQPKVLDFGIARVLTPGPDEPQLTGEGQIVGTIAYMSPEQALGRTGQVDTRSDVYSLGLMAYELLTGRLPYDARGQGVHEAAAIISEQEPTPAGRLDRSLRGDLEVILAKALEKEPDHRYPTVAALAEDIRRYLSDQPVLAHPHTAMYQIRKLVRRHRGAVGATAAVLLTLVVGVIGTSYGLLQAVSQRNAAIKAKGIADAERAEADRRRAAAEAVTSLIQEMLGSASPHRSKGADYTVRRLLDDFSAGLEKRLEGQPEALAALRATIGSAYRQLGQYQQAEPHLTGALDLRRRLYGPGDAVVAQSLDDLAWLRHDQADYEGAAALFREALATRRTQFGEEHAATADSMHSLADVLRHQEKLDEAEPLARRTLEIRRALLGDADSDTAESMAYLGKLLMGKGDYAGAEPLVREAIDVWRAAYGTDHPNIADSLNDLGWLRHSRGDDVEAEGVLREALAMGERLLGPDHPDVANSLYELGLVLQDRGDKEGEAEPMLRRALEMYRAAHGNEHPSVATALDGLATVLRARKDLEGAGEAYSEALAIRRRLYGDDHVEVAISLNNLALIQRAAGRFDEAERMFREALRVHRSAWGARHPIVATDLGNLGALLVAAGRAEEAEPVLIEALDQFRELTSLSNPQTIGTSVALGRLYMHQERWSEGEQLLGAAVFGSRARSSPSRDLGALLVDHGRCLLKLDRLSEAESDLREGHEALTASLGPGHSRTLAAARDLIVVYERTGQADKAEALRSKLEGAEGEPAPPADRPPSP